VSSLLAGGVAGLYIFGVIGVHRLNVRRQRLAAGGFRALRWLDWDALLSGLEPPLPSGVPRPSPELSAPGVYGGGPAPELLASPPLPGGEARRLVLTQLVAGHAPSPAVLESVGFSGGQVRWVEILSLLIQSPDRALERLESGEPGTPAELYLREHLALTHRTNGLNLEVSVFASKYRLTHGLTRYGERPELFFVRALASALVGFNQAAIDDLARAVYFSRQAPFYVRAVLETPYLAEARPALVQQCQPGESPLPSRSRTS
jgi:hypothetical protein